MSTTYIENDEVSAVVEAWKVIDQLTDDPRIMELPLADAIRAIAAGNSNTQSDSHQVSVDSELLDWLEEQAAVSSSGICVDYCSNLDDGQVLEKGWRVMRRHYLGPRGTTLRRRSISRVRIEPRGDIQG